MHCQSRLQVGSGNPGQPRCHDLRHQSQRPVHVWRRDGLFSRADHFGQRHARHPAGRSAARFAHRPAHGHSVFVQRHRRRQTSRPPATGSMKPRSAAKPTIFIFRTPGRPRPNLTINYGLRYEVNSRIHEAEHRTSLPRFVDASGKDVPYWDHNAKQIFLYNPQPPYDQDWKRLGPRLSVDYAVTSHTVLHAGGCDYIDCSESVAGQFPYRGHSPRHQPLCQRLAQYSLAVPEFRGAGNSSASVHHSGQTTISQRGCQPRARRTRRWICSVIRTI